MVQLRGIFRNVQLYLLFFSGLLVLVALQHMQWYDQGIAPYAHTLLDKPSYGSPEDAATGVLYLGDESKEIGIFKFKVGLFKFALPTFSNERTSRLREDRLRGPLPDRRTKNTRLNTNVPQSFNWSVGYVVILSSNTAIATDIHPSLRDRAAVLSSSIRRAHKHSPYEFKIYAAIPDLSSSALPNWNFISSPEFRDSMGKLGYTIVVFSAVNLHDELDRDAKFKSHRDASIQSVLKEHDLVVHISMDSFLLKPVDSLFDSLMGETGGRGYFGIHGASDDTINSATPQPDLLTFAPPNVTFINSSPKHVFINKGDLLILKTKSDGAATSHLDLLKCLYSAQDTILPSSEIESSRTGSVLTVHPKPRSLLQPRVASVQSRNTACPRITDNVLTLNRCRYDAGSRVYDTNGCAGVDADTAVIASFLDEDEPSVCVKPWECEREEDGGGCVRYNGGTSSMLAHCSWLQREWFSLARNATQ